MASRRKKKRGPAKNRRPGGNNRRQTNSRGPNRVKKGTGKNGVTTSMRSVSAPLAQGSVITNRGAAKSVRINHKELVADLAIPATVGNFNTYEINPGLSTVFPWLSQIAQRYESYYFNSLKFHWLTAVPTTTSGTLALVPDYDAADDDSSITKVELFSFEDATRGPWWQNFTLTCSVRNLRKTRQYYVRAGDLASNLDIKTYDALQLITYSSGTEVVEGAGELWVEYDITLITPQMKHLSEALGVKRSESVLDVGTDGIVADPFATINNLMESNTFDLADDETGFGVVTPGYYGFDLDNIYVPTGTYTSYMNPVNYDTFRDCQYSADVTAFMNSGSTKGAINGIWEIFTNALNPASYGFLGLEIVASQLNVGLIFMTLTELLAKSARRTAHLKSPRRLKYIGQAEYRTKLRAQLHREGRLNHEVWNKFHNTVNKLPKKIVHMEAPPSKTCPPQKKELETSEQDETVSDPSPDPFTRCGEGLIELHENITCKTCNWIRNTGLWNEKFIIEASVHFKERCCSCTHLAKLKRN